MGMDSSETKEGTSTFFNQDGSLLPPFVSIIITNRLLIISFLIDYCDVCIYSVFTASVKSLGIYAHDAKSMPPAHTHIYYNSYVFYLCQTPFSAEKSNPTSFGSFPWKSKPHSYRGPCSR